MIFVFYFLKRDFVRRFLNVVCLLLSGDGPGKECHFTHVTISTTSMCIISALEVWRMWKMSAECYANIFSPVITETNDPLLFLRRWLTYVRAAASAAGGLNGGADCCTMYEMNQYDCKQGTAVHCQTVTLANCRDCRFVTLCRSWAFLQPYFWDLHWLLFSSSCPVPDCWLDVPVCASK